MFSWRITPWPDQVISMHPSLMGYLPMKINIALPYTLFIVNTILISSCSSNPILETANNFSTESPQYKSKLEHSEIIYEASIAIEEMLTDWQ